MGMKERIDAMTPGIMKSMKGYDAHKEYWYGEGGLDKGAFGDDCPVYKWPLRSAKYHLTRFFASLSDVYGFATGLVKWGLALLFSPFLKKLRENRPSFPSIKKLLQAAFYLALFAPAFVVLFPLGFLGAIGGWLSGMQGWAIFTFMPHLLGAGLSALGAINISWGAVLAAGSFLTGGIVPFILVPLAAAFFLFPVLSKLFSAPIDWLADKISPEKTEEADQEELANVLSQEKQPVQPQQPKSSTDPAPFLSWKEVNARKEAAKVAENESSQDVLAADRRQRAGSGEPRTPAKEPK